MRRATLVALALAASSCAPRLAKLSRLPSGPGTRVPAGTASALEQATAPCLALKTLTADIAVSGTAGGHRVRGRMSAGVAAPASARLEAAAPFGAPLFIFVATGDDATLVLPRDARVLQHGRPAEVLDAVAGVPLGAADLERVLTGCPAPAAAEAPVVQLGDRWQRVTRGDGEQTYLHRENGAAPWRLAVVVGPAWRVDYVDRRRDVPATIRLTSVDAGGKMGAAFNLQLSLSQVETNVPLDAEVFRVRIPPDATPISLDELRHARPGSREN